MKFSLTLFAFLAILAGSVRAADKKPNVVFVFGDQWRAQAMGYMGNQDVRTPNLDRLAAESVNLRNAVATCPVCTPYRGMLLSGQYPLTSGVFLNDVMLDPEAPTMGKIFKKAGYDTAYIGKWHLDGHGRSSFIPRERRQGFDYWKVLECTHNYNNSSYWGNDNKFHQWAGYDAIAQTDDAIGYIRDHAKKEKPFLLVMSWGPPHAPYETAPKKYQQMYADAKITLRKNVPEAIRARAVKTVRGYYAHCTALDDCVGRLQEAIRKAGIEGETIFVFTSDHGDMLHSHGQMKKQRIHDESARVPMLWKYPGHLEGKGIDAPVGTLDILPTLLGLASLPTPETACGRDFSDAMLGQQPWQSEDVLIFCPHPFGQYLPPLGKEYRGLRTKQYTYGRDRNGPWVLFDNRADPFQTNNLVDDPASSEIVKQLDARLQQRLDAFGDKFLSGMDYVKKWGYHVNSRGTVNYRDTDFRGRKIDPRAELPAQKKEEK